MAANSLRDIMCEIGHATVKLLAGNMIVFKSTLKDELAERISTTEDDRYVALLNDAIDFLDRDFK
ncbi:hypothetical protein [Providencia rettgeri]|uniref:hypothetical protein n=1 Tax=Providencia rettgeri TaxID=587 RepID=UPI002361D09A|nr:hypothetical protein [Providencia rettgeri]